MTKIQRRYFGPRFQVASDPAEADFLLYTRINCLMCDMARRYLDAFCQRTQKKYYCIDIDNLDKTESALVEQHQLDLDKHVPVLMFRGQEICRHELDPAVLDRLVE